MNFISQADIVHHTKTIFQSKEKFLFCILTINDIVILQGGSKMYSKRLREKGLLHFIGGSDYHFRQTASEERILADYQRLFKEAGINEPDEIYSGHQTHSSNVAWVDNTMGEPFIIGEQFPNTDGLFTMKENVALIIKFADCTPIVLYDPIEKVQALVHSGWRGTVFEISKNALQKMIEEGGSKIENILAYIGPSIDQDHYEVGPEVYEAFSMNPDRERFFKPHGNKFLLDMTLANYHLLLQSGIKEENIEIEQTSTFIDKNLHSARQEGKDYQLNALVTCMK